MTLGSNYFPGAEGTKGRDWSYQKLEVWRASEVRLGPLRKEHCLASVGTAEQP